MWTLPGRQAVHLVNIFLRKKGPRTTLPCDLNYPIQHHRILADLNTPVADPETSERGGGKKHEL